MVRNIWCGGFAGVLDVPDPMPLNAARRQRGGGADDPDVRKGKALAMFQGPFAPKLQELLKLWAALRI